MDFEKRIEALAKSAELAKERMERAEARMDRSDQRWEKRWQENEKRWERAERQIQATANLVRQGIKIVVEQNKRQAALDAKFNRLIESLGRATKNGNGKH